MADARAAVKYDWRPRLMIADDHGVVGASLAALLRRWFDVVAVVTRLEEIIPAAEELEPQVAVLDLSFGVQGTCMDLIAPLRAAVNECRVIILTAHDSPALADGARAAGASAFVPKSISPAALRETILAALQDEPDVPPWPLPTVAAIDQTPLLAFDLMGLTPREAVVTLLIYSGRTQADIATMLGISPCTVEYYRRAVAKRTGISRMSLFIRWVEEHREQLVQRASTATWGEDR